ncbi:protein containing Transcriptional regulator, TetR-like, DNA-binding, bacterial/archaeal domain [Pseudovibrio sp. FO-BEG1]|uniref:TetR/AcrR family transcriptional regulator n=1 Tax=Pseudovibrio sp. (strain FO-BEG1) TaxID=911045 RepID=UPI000238BFD3|nr:TetR family transcriptional regulator [Pseudovibrio sp. FO-BEG1]AEV39447.1 protein containing Transcriptional regulator, TetR-like, DNA-binding, bacterial/archaeal domain [Pseudovibrio sp. FO-BEG1]
MQTNPQKPRDTRARILSSAVEVFMQFGFRKSSLNDVAQAANVSRQALYLHFKDKTDLFREASAFTFEENLKLVQQAAHSGKPLQDIITEMFGIWHGQYVGKIDHVASDFVAAAIETTGDIMQSAEASFLSEVAAAIEQANLPHLQQTAEGTPLKIARLLNTYSKGLKQEITTEKQYRAGMTEAAETMLGLSK